MDNFAKMAVFGLKLSNSGELCLVGELALLVLQLDHFVTRFLQRPARLALCLFLQVIDICQRRVGGQ